MGVYKFMKKGGGLVAKLNLMSRKIRPLLTNKALLIVACTGLLLNLGQPGRLSFNEASSVVLPFQSGYSYNTLFLKPFKNETKNVSPVKFKVTVTAYSSTVCQTDNTPFETASGQMVRDGIIAANFLPFGTKVRLPELYGDKVFEVQDRMNRRYKERVDIWFEDTNEAIHFGIKDAVIEVL